MLRSGNPRAMPKRALTYIPAMLTNSTSRHCNQETATRWAVGEVAVTRSGFLRGFRYVTRRLHQSSPVFDRRALTALGTPFRRGC
jgi:hypothetical protein